MGLITSIILSICLTVLLMLSGLPNYTLFTLSTIYNRLLTLYIIAYFFEYLLFLSCPFWVLALSICTVDFLYQLMFHNLPTLTLTLIGILAHNVTETIVPF